MRGLCLYPNNEPVNLLPPLKLVEAHFLAPDSGKVSGLVGDTGFLILCCHTYQQVLHYTYEEACQIGDSISLSVYQPLSDSMVHLRYQL